MRDFGQFILNWINRSAKLPRYLLLLVLMYMYIYNPVLQISGFGVIKILLFISVGYLFICKKYSIVLSTFKNEIFFTYFLVVYSFIAAVFGDGSALTTPYQHIIWFLECFLIPCFLIFCFKDVFEKISWDSILILTGFIASLITFYLILNPDLNMYVRDRIIIDTRDTVTKADVFGDYRGFTFAEGSMYSYGVVQGIILALCLYSMTRSFLFVFPVIFLFVSILFNARIGFAPLIIFIILIILYRKIKTFYLIFIAIILIAGYYIFTNLPVFEEYQETLKWGMDFYKDAEMFLKGEQKLSNYTILVEYMVFFPQKLSGLIFGEGRSVFGLGLGYGSDIGYINQIFIGGLSYLALMMFFLLYFFKRLYSYSTDTLIPLLFIITLFVANIKGLAFFVSHGFFRLISFYYIYHIFVNERFNKNNIIPPNTVKR